MLGAVENADSCMWIDASSSQLTPNVLLRGRVDRVEAFHPASLRCAPASPSERGSPRAPAARPTGAPRSRAACARRPPPAGAVRGAAVDGTGVCGRDEHRRRRERLRLPDRAAEHRDQHRQADAAIAHASSHAPRSEGGAGGCANVRRRLASRATGP